MLSVANSCHYNENSKNDQNRLQTNARPSGATPTNSLPPPRAKARMQRPQGRGKSLVQIPRGARGWLWMKLIPALGQRRKRFIINTEKCNVKRMMYPHLGFYVCPSCGVCSDDICVIGYNKSTFMHKKRKCIKEMNIFNRKLENSFVKNLLRSLIV